MDPELSDLTLERYALGELPPAGLAAVRDRLATDPALQARLDALLADNEAFLAAHPPARVVPRLLARARPAPRVAWVAVPMLAAAAAVFFVLRPETATGPEVVLVKGAGPQLRVHRAADAGPEALADGATAHEGDVLQLTYTGGRGYGVIVSIDGRGTVTPHLGAPGEPAPALDRGGAALPDAYELDDAPRFERFLFVTGEAPFAADTVFRAAQALAADPSHAAQAPLALPAGLTQGSVILWKELP